VKMARTLYNDKTNTVTNICTTLGISRATLYRSLDAPATLDTQSADRDTGAMSR